MKSRYLGKHLGAAFPHNQNKAGRELPLIKVAGFGQNSILTLRQLHHELGCEKTWFRRLYIILDAGLAYNVC
jgi:hypothetical protein